MKTTTKTIEELLKSEESPLPLQVIPNNMGINLCSVEALTWTKKDDGQLVNLTIHFYLHNKGKNMIGLMGVDNDGKTIYTPSGKKICKLPFGLAWKVQKIQHWIARKTWR